jgi:hypothetical protein
MSGPDYYRILQVEPDAPAPIIHASYRTLVRRAVGPDRGSVDIAALDAAYAVLGDSQRRAAYDRNRAVGADAAQDLAAGTTAKCLFCGDLHRFDRVLERDDECATCASPLYPAGRQQVHSSRPRTLRRIPKRHAVSVWVTWPQSAPILGDMRNLSLDGMAFESNVLFQVNQIVRVECTELHALGRIAHAEPATSGVYRFSAGVEFVTLRVRDVGRSFAPPDE